MLVPSIDIMNGRAVQLRKGKEFVLESERDPVELAREFNRYGEVAVIDLDAALGNGNNLELLSELCSVADVRVGGGIRDIDTARQLLRAGAKTLIIGTNATPEFLSQLPAAKVMVALDNVNGMVVDNGWKNATGEPWWVRAERLSKYCSGFLVTFVETEGTLQGIPFEEAQAVVRRLDKPVTVAGGIRSSEEVEQLSKADADVQVGMGIYKGLIDPVDCVVKSINFGTDGLVPTIVQDVSGQVLMLAYSTAESLRAALSEGRGIYYSRSRKEIWRKGDTSGSVQQLVACRVDCDRDSILFRVEQTNDACHRELYSCFGQASANKRFSMYELFDVLLQRKANAPAGSYSAKLFSNRELLLDKLTEEANEVRNFTSKENLRWEIADLLYFASALAVDEGLGWQEIESELGGRRR